MHCLLITLTRSLSQIRLRAFLIEHALDERGPVVLLDHAGVVVFLAARAELVVLPVDIVIRVVLEQLLILLLILQIGVLQVLALLSSAILETLERVTGVVGAFPCSTRLIFKVVVARALHVIYFLCRLLQGCLLIGRSQTLAAGIARATRQERSLSDLLRALLPALVLLLLEPLVERRLGARVLHGSASAEGLDRRRLVMIALTVAFLAESLTLRIEIVRVISVSFLARWV